MVRMKSLTYLFNNQIIIIMKRTILLCAAALAITSAAVLSATINVNAAESAIKPQYSNDPPGPQGNRHSQAVQCGVGGWVIKPGCCFGDEDCLIMDPCKGASFSCDGMHYVEAGGSKDDIIAHP